MKTEKLKNRTRRPSAPIERTALRDPRTGKDSFSETFGLPPHLKRRLAFGIIFFGAGMAASFAFMFIPEFNRFPACRWIWLACALGHASFAVLSVLVWRKRNDCIEVSANGITARKIHGRNVMLQWDEIATVEEALQRRCLFLRSRQGKSIRFEYQFGRFADFLCLLEQNLTHLGQVEGSIVFRKHRSFYAAHLIMCAFFTLPAAWAIATGYFWGATWLLLTLLPLAQLHKEPLNAVIGADSIRIDSLFRKREIALANIRNVQLEAPLDPQGNGRLEVMIAERGTGTATRLPRLEKIFHLHAVLHYRHEQAFSDQSLSR